MMRSAVMAVLLLGCFAVESRAQNPDLATVTAGMQKRYAAMGNVSAKFIQEVRFGFSNIRQEFKGTLLMRKPNRFRIESENQVLVTDGSTVWAYSPANKQVVVDRYKENKNSITPERFLGTIPENYYATILGTEAGKAGRLITLKLVPKDDASFIRAVRLVVEDGTWTVRRISIEDVNETTTEYIIEDLNLDAPIDEASFTFLPPPGTDIVDLR